MPHSVLIGVFCIVYWLWNFPSWYNKNYWTLQTSQTRGPGWITFQKMFTYDLLFHLIPTFAPIPHGQKSPGLAKHIFKQRSLSYKKKVSVQYGKVLLEISYSTPWVNHQCALQCSLILSLLIKDLIHWFHLFWCLYMDKHNFKWVKGNGDRQQLRNCKHKGKHKVSCYQKSLLILTAYQVQGWWTMILSPVKYQTNVINVREIILKSSWHTHLNIPSHTHLFYKIGEASRWMLYSSIICLSNHPDIWWYICTCSIQANQNQYQIDKGCQQKTFQEKMQNQEG